MMTKHDRSITITQPQRTRQNSLQSSLIHGIIKVAITHATAEE